MVIGKLALLGMAAAAGGAALLFTGGTAHAAPGTSSGAPPAPPVNNPNAPPPDVLKIIQQAKDSANPAVLLNTADMLAAMGLTAQAQDLRALAAEIAAVTGQPPPVQTVTTGPAPSPSSPLPVPPAPAPPINVPQLPGFTPTVVLPPLVVAAAPADPGKALAGELTAMLQGVRRRGNEDKGLVGAFQQQELAKGTYTPLAIQFLDRKPTVADELYGAVTAVLVSSYGIVPVKPMYWSSDPAKAKKQKAMFTALMLEKASSDPTRVSEWTAVSNVANS